MIGTLVCAPARRRPLVLWVLAALGAQQSAYVKSNWSRNRLPALA